LILAKRPPLDLFQIQTGGGEYGVESVISILINQENKKTNK